MLDITVDNEHLELDGKHYKFTKEEMINAIIRILDEVKYQRTNVTLFEASTENNVKYHRGEWYG